MVVCCIFRVGILVGTVLFESKKTLKLFESKKTLKFPRISPKPYIKLTPILPNVEIE
jgi:hypothetical protein